jgi:hypothetical protein
MMGRSTTERVYKGCRAESLRTHPEQGNARQFHLGRQYLIGVNAINCANGDSLAQEQVQAATKEEVIKALGKASTSLRQKLGESLSSVQKFGTPREGCSLLQEGC